METIVFAFVFVDDIAAVFLETLILIGCKSFRADFGRVELEKEKRVRGLRRLRRGSCDGYDFFVVNLSTAAVVLSRRRR